MIFGAVPALGVVYFGLLAPTPSQIVDTEEYRDRLHAMWIGQTIANWTGLRTELRRNQPPFFTDGDWGGVTDRGPIEFVLDQDPWGADDDTDIEYVYTHLIETHQTLDLTPAQIADGWRRHINDFIWVSNARARQLMGEGLHPPATGMAATNPDGLMIDAQLTTELFGAYAPGMPEVALRISALPIRTTARGHAAHAAQFHVLLYSLAAVVPEDLSRQEQVLWLVDHARAYLPDSSKAADIIDFVRQDFLANPDKDDWERTRDRVHTRYQRDTAANGFAYRGAFESTINLGAGVMALLYGGGDYRRTVRIGTLAGWDSDNPTATMGGLLGLLYGTAEIRAMFPEVALSDRYHSARTRDNLPDFLPGDPAAEDTFALLVDRMMPWVHVAVASGGGRLAPAGQLWILPPTPDSPPVQRNPLWRLFERSANNRVRLDGGVPLVYTSDGVNDPAVADGVTYDFSGREVFSDSEPVYTSARGLDTLWIAVTYPAAVEVSSLRFVEGPHGGGGGWFEELTSVKLLVGGRWIEAAEWGLSEALDPGRGYQEVEIYLPAPRSVEGIWIEGRPGGDGGFVTCLELDGFSRP